mmetsp:Transcript_38867/g.108116  ORF Transcript_38867/g.108116 Transcript_38867/m.108116 type:complete len:224 (-) Transcript_38867:1450-2121(-)
MAKLLDLLLQLLLTLSCFVTFLFELGLLCTEHLQRLLELCNLFLPCLEFCFVRFHECLPELRTLRVLLLPLISKLQLVLKLLNVKPFLARGLRTFELCLCLRRNLGASPRSCVACHVELVDLLSAEGQLLLQLCVDGLQLCRLGLRLAGLCLPGGPRRGEPLRSSPEVLLPLLGQFELFAEEFPFPLVRLLKIALHLPVGISLLHHSRLQVNDQLSMCSLLCQ